MNTDINWAIRQKTSMACKLVLIILANRANKSHQCFPSLTSLTTDSGMARRSIMRSLLKLESLGLIARAQRGVSTTLYTLLVGTERPYRQGQSDPRDRVTLGTESHMGRAKHNTEVGPQWPTEPKEEPKVNPKRGSARARKRASAIPPPDVFEITPALIVWAAKENITANITEETAKMLDHFRGNGGLKADWPATWRNWMRNADTFNRRRNGGNRNGSHKPTDWEKNVAALKTFVDCEVVTEMRSDIPDVRKDPR